MSGADRSVAQVMDAGDWRPSTWTLVCVGALHVIIAATILTSVTPPMTPPELIAVDVVTFPDGTSTPTRPNEEALPVELKETRPNQELPVPQIERDPRLGPRPTDKRPLPTPITKTEPTPAVPEAATEPVPVPVLPTPVPVSAASPKAVPVPAQVPAQVPVQAPEAVPLLKPEPVIIANAPTAPSLVQPTPTPLSIAGAKLKLKKDAALKPLNPLDLRIPERPITPAPAPSPAIVNNVPAPSLPNPVLPTPALPSSAPKLVPTPAQPLAVARTPSPPPPPFAQPKTVPLTIAKARTPLPQVQVPRITATDLRLPEVQAAGEPAPRSPSGAPAPTAPSGVTSVAGASPRTANGQQSGQQGRAGATLPAGGGGQSGAVSASNSPAGSSGGSGPSGATGSPTTTGSGGSTGILPRRPGGASVRQTLPTGDDTTVLGRMNKTFDCSRLNRERDERCPKWDPIEGRNSQGSTSFEVPVPKGLPTLRNPIGTNPLPVCPPGTPGNQMGLSCLPSREGPGIPRP